MSAALFFIRSLVGVMTNPAALLLIVAAYTAGHIKGGRSAADRCNVAALNSKIEALTMDQKAAEAAAKRFEAEAQASSDRAEKNAAIIKEISRAAKSPACRLSDADARRVYSIQ